MTLHLVTVIGQHTELTEVGAIPGRFLEVHDREGTEQEMVKSGLVTVRDREVLRRPQIQGWTLSRGQGFKSPQLHAGGFAT
jgi:hypothetical protein